MTTLRSRDYDVTIGGKRFFVELDVSNSYPSVGLTEPKVSGETMNFGDFTITTSPEHHQTIKNHLFNTDFSDNKTLIEQCIAKNDYEGLYQFDPCTFEKYVSVEKRLELLKNQFDKVSTVLVITGGLVEASDYYDHNIVTIMKSINYKHSEKLFDFFSDFGDLTIAVRQAINDETTRTQFDAIHTRCINEGLKDFTVEDIPNVMKKLNWLKSADLMEKWLENDAYAMSNGEKDPETFEDKSNRRNYPYVDYTTFSWEWLNSYEIVRDALDEICESDYLYSIHAKKEICNRFDTFNKLRKIKFDTIIETFNGNIMDLHSDWQFQFYNIGTIQYAKELDDNRNWASGIFNYFGDVAYNDLYASLAKFSLYAAITKFQLIKNTHNGKLEIHILEIALYMKDTFDFNDVQYLGHWNSNGLYRDIETFQDNAESQSYHFTPGIGYVKPFNNSNFREYRQAKGKGRDFYIFSDLKLIKYEPEKVIIIELY